MVSVSFHTFSASPLYPPNFPIFLFTFWYANFSTVWTYFSSDNAKCRFRGCEPLTLTCPSCSCSFECAPIFSSICSSIRQNPADLQVGESASKVWERFSCPKCPEESEGNISSALIANQVCVLTFNWTLYNYVNYFLSSAFCHLKCWNT